MEQHHLSPGGEHLRRLRLSRGLSQAQLARLAGVSHSFVNMAERGTRRPREWMLERLARALGLDEAGTRELKEAFYEGLLPAKVVQEEQPQLPGSLPASLGKFLALPKGSPKAPEVLKALWHDLFETMSNKMEETEEKKVLDCAALLSLGYFSTSPTGRQKGTRKKKRDYENEMADALKELIGLFVESPETYSKRAGIARETVSYVKFQLSKLQEKDSQ